MFSTVFKKHNIRVAFKTNSSIGNMFINTKDLVPPLHKSGIYQINCLSCNSIYLGQSGRRLDTRFREHCHHINKYKGTDICNTQSSFANHILSTNHDFSISSVSLIHPCTKGTRMNLLELSEIHKALNNKDYNCLNEQIQTKENYIFLNPHNY